MIERFKLENLVSLKPKMSIIVLSMPEVSLAQARNFYLDLMENIHLGPRVLNFYMAKNLFNIE